MKMQEEEEWLSMSPPTGQTRRLQPAQIDSTGADVKENKTNTNADIRSWCETLQTNSNSC